MKRALAWSAAAAVVAAVAWFALRSSDDEPARAAAEQAAEPAAQHGGHAAAREAAQPADVRFARAAAAASGSAAADEELKEGVTPPIEVPATEKDGLAEVHVRASGAPVAAAEVTLYLRGAVDRTTGHPRWRVAGAARTDKEGVARIFARAGRYLATAHSGKLAPARKEFSRPQGEKATKVLLDLEAGHALVGRTMQRGGKEPVPLATILVTQALGPPTIGRRGGQGRPDAPPEEISHGTSDEHGRFRIEGLSTGTYRVEASATGYSRGAAAHASVPHDGELTLEMAASGFLEGNVVAQDGSPAGGALVAAASGPQFASATASDKGAFSIEVEPRTYKLSAARGREAGTLERSVSVAPGATVRGLVIQLGAASGVDGVVLSALTNGPVPGATISVAPYRGQGTVTTSTSDAAGNFVLEGLAPGSYDLYTSADGYSPDARRGVTMMQGQRFPITIQLHMVGGIDGVVKSAMTGQPIPFASVSASSMGSGNLGGRINAFIGMANSGATTDPPVTVRADEVGHFTLTGLIPGSQRLLAQRDGSDFGDSQVVEVPEGQVAHADFSLKDEGVVVGRVTRKTGAPMTTLAHVRASPTGQGFRGGGQAAQVDTDAGGNYRLVLPQGSYAVLATTDATPGFNMRGSRNVAVITAGQTLQKDLQVDDTADANALSGNVLEPGGEPSVGALVRLMGGGGRGGGMGFQMAMTDETGAFSIAGVRSNLPAQFQIAASNGGRTATVAATPDQPSVTVQLQPGSKLTGRVTGQTPVQGFGITITPIGQNGWPMRFAGQDLEFAGDSFTVDDVPPQQLHVSVHTRDGRAGEADTTLAAGQPGNVTVQLVEVFSVSGRALAPDGTPLKQGFAVVDRDPSKGVPISGDGRFKIDGIAPGAHTLQINSPQLQAKQVPFNAGGGAPPDLGDIAMTAAAAAPGTIGVSVRPDGDGVTIVSVVPLGPAAQAGLLAGDSLVAVDGAPVPSAQAATAMLTGAPGSTVNVTIRRAGNASTVPVTRAM